MDTHDERRRYQRLPTTYIVRYRARNTQDDYDIIQTQDISQGGTVLLTSKMFTPGDQLEMHIQFPFAKERIMVVGKVVACTEKHKGLVYETRVAFIEMREGVKKKIGEIIDRRSH